jgi:hypothetical protein
MFLVCGPLLETTALQFTSSMIVPTTPEVFRHWYDAQQLPAGTPVALETGTVGFSSRGS